jgi:voltage-gated potassium channel
MPSQAPPSRKPSEPPAGQWHGRLMITWLERKPLTARRAAIGISIVTLVITLGSAFVVWLLDREDFPTYGRALWWAVQTVTTVGYGDDVPTHVEGQIVGAIVMLTAVGLVAVITAAITASFVQGARERLMGRGDEALARQLTQLAERLERIEEKLERR